MRTYKLYLDGVWYRDEDGNDVSYKLTNSRDSKKAALTYGRNATITDMSGRIVSKAMLDATGSKAYNVAFDPDVILEDGAEASQ